MSYKYFQQIDDGTKKGAAINQLARMSSGAKEFATIVYSGASADGDKIVIGGKNLFVKQINSGSLTLADSTLNNTNTGTILNVGITAHGLSVNHIILVGSEYLKVARVGDADHVDLVRGYAGSTVAAHASSASVKTAANYTGVDVAHDYVIPVGSTLAIATSGPLLATAINAFAAASIAGQVLYGMVAEYDSAKTCLLLSRPAQGNALSISETITNATMLNSATTFTNGVEKGDTYLATVTRVPTAADVTAGWLDFIFPFPVKDVTIAGRTTSTRAPATIGSTVSFNSDFTRVRLTNNATNDFAATHTIRVTANG